LSRYDVNEQGTLPTVLLAAGHSLLTTTIFVKYNYRSIPGAANELVQITAIALPNGLLQDRYNPDANHTFWLAGRNAPTRGEVFRVRIVIDRLKALARWRVQRIHLVPTPTYTWDS
jgi:Type II restriction enzyme SfiI